MPKMTIAAATEECKRWLAFLDEQAEKSKRYQELAHMARNGQQEEAMRQRQAMDKQPKVFDISRLRTAVECLIATIEKPGQKS